MPRNLVILVMLSIPLVISAQNATIVPAPKAIGSLEYSAPSFRNQLFLPLTVQRQRAVLEASSPPMQATTWSYAHTSGDTVGPQSGENTMMESTAPASELPTRKTDKYPLSRFFSGPLAKKVILRWGNSTVWNSSSYYYKFFSQTKPTGILAGMTVRSDVQSISSDSSGNVTVVLSSAPDSTLAVGRFVSFWPAKPSLARCLGTGPIKAISGNTFTFAFKMNGPCTDVASTLTRGYVSTQILNFGANGNTLSNALANSDPTSLGIAGVCAVKPDLMIFRGYLINDVRKGATDLTAAKAMIQSALTRLRSCSPNTDVILETENSLLSVDTGEHYVIPNSNAQAYSQILEQAIVAFANTDADVYVIDTQGGTTTSIYGVTSKANSVTMQDQLHPNQTGQAAEGTQDLQILYKVRNLH